MCRNAAVSGRHHSPRGDARPATGRAGRRAWRSCCRAARSPRRAADTAVTTNIATLTAIRPRVTAPHRRPAACSPPPRAARADGGVALPDALRALEPDRGRDHALRADRPLAAGAGDAGGPVRVAVAGGWSGAPAGCSVSCAAPRRTRSRRRRRAGRCGRSGTLAIASTTSRLASSATSPKIVCLRLRCGVGPDGDEELRAVGARAGVGHGQQVRPVEGQLGVELVAELVAGAAEALTERVAALDHEAADDPVEDRAVVERVGGLLRGSPGGSTRGGPRRGRRSWRPSSARGPGRGRR